MAENTLPYEADNSQSSARHCFAITKSDDNELVFVTRGIRVGTAGDVAVLLMGDSAPVTIPSVQAGETLQVRARKVMATGTTASGLVGFA